MQGYMSEPRFCEYCGKCLCKIGNNRKNGKGNYNDWANRPYHKKCFKAISESKNNIYMMYYDNDEDISIELKKYKDRLERIKKIHEDARSAK